MCFLGLLFANIPLYSQLKISGKVTSATDNEPMVGATVVVKGTTIGTATDVDGNYAIEVKDKNAILVFQFIGFITQEVNAEGRPVINVAMAENINQMGEVVVTAMGMKREKRSLGYAMQEIKTEGFAEVRSVNVANMLQGKVAGVQIAQSSSGTGGSTRVVMRGLNSLSGNNQPLWIVDGIPVDDSYNGSFSEWGGSDIAGAASEINPDDIESISVLKGANAAALYGSRAQSGAIVITTKGAKQNQPLSVEYNGNFNWDKIYDGYDFQWKYGQGNGGNFDITSKDGWGPVMSGQTIENWRKYYYDDDNAQSYAMTAQKDRIKDFFQTGFNSSNSISIQGGGDKLASRFAFTNTDNQGVTSNNKINRKYFDSNTNYKNNKLTVNFKATYSHQETENRVSLGEYGLMQMFTKMPANIRLSDLKNDLSVDDVPMNWSGGSSEYVNPYNYTNSKKSSIEKRDRVTGVASVNYKFNEWLGVTGKTGMDYWTTIATSAGLKGYSGTNPGYYMSSTNLREVNSDIMLNINKSFGDFTLISNLGAAKMNRKSEGLYASSGTLVIYGFNNLSNGSNQSVSQSYSEKEIQSVLGNAQLAFKNFIYLDLSARNDWSSTLSSDNQSYFYPSVSLSGIISDMVKLPEPISFLKVRTSWAQVGNDTEPYRLSETYWLSHINGTVLYANGSSTAALTDLKPENTTSTEFGFDLRMLENRIGVDFTYYNSKTTNQILSITTPYSSGYTGKFINAGELKSSGLEIMITTVPVRTKDFEWNLNLNWGKNVTECVELDETISRYVLGSMRIGEVVVDEGGRFGDIRGYAYQRDANGKILIDAEGLPMGTSEYQKIGNMTPDWTGSISNQLTYKGFVFNSLIDIRYGGDILSYTDALATIAGTSERTLTGRDGMVVNGVSEATGTANAQEVTSEAYWQSVGGPFGIAEEYIYDASYVNVRELSLGYYLPKTVLNKVSFIKNAKVSLVGRDLFYLYKNTPGTSPEGASTRQDWVQAFELNSLPPTRNIGFNISLTF